MDRFIGQVTMFAGNFAPHGWVECDGQLLEVDGHPELYSLIGTAHGGDGRVTFGVPKLAPPSPGMRYMIAVEGSIPVQW